MTLMWASHSFDSLAAKVSGQQDMWQSHPQNLMWQQIWGRGGEGREAKLRPPPVAEVHGRITVWGEDIKGIWPH